MQIKQMVRKVKNIIIGTINNIFNLKQDLSSPRIKICIKCEHCKECLFIGKICDICGCILDSKTRVESEKCKLNKW